MSFFDPSAATDIHKRNLPHWEQGDVWVFVTWRLADSLPQSKLRELEREREMWRKFHPEPWTPKVTAEYHKQFTNQLEAWLDRGAGSCLLRKPVNSAIVANALRHFDEQRYRLATYVVMPNHVHALFQLITPHALAEVLRSWKNFTASQINRREGRSGTLWQPEYWDRLIRSEEHFVKCVEYIAQNPVKARLRPGEYILGERGSGPFTGDV